MSADVADTNMRGTDVMVRRRLHRALDGQVDGVVLDRLARDVTADLVGVGLITDPERTLGLVLRRVPGGGWTADSDPRPRRSATAAGWAAQCARAGALAARLTATCGTYPEVTSVRADHERVVISLHPEDLPQFGAWLAWTAAARVRSVGYAAIADGRRDGVPVRLVAHGVPGLHAKATARPYIHQGVEYRPGVTYRDRAGRVWETRGLNPGGVLLLGAPGRAEQHPLPRVVRTVGPLTAVDGEAL